MTRKGTRRSTGGHGFWLKALDVTCSCGGRASFVLMNAHNAQISGPLCRSCASSRLRAANREATNALKARPTQLEREIRAAADEAILGRRAPRSGHGEQK